MKNKKLFVKLLRAVALFPMVLMTNACSGTTLIIVSDEQVVSAINKINHKIHQVNAGVETYNCLITKIKNNNYKILTQHLTNNKIKGIFNTTKISNLRITDLNGLVLSSADINNSNNMLQTLIQFNYGLAQAITILNITTFKINSQLITNTIKAQTYYLKQPKFKSKAVENFNSFIAWENYRFICNQIIDLDIQSAFNSKLLTDLIIMNGAKALDQTDIDKQAIATPMTLTMNFKYDRSNFTNTNLTLQLQHDGDPDLINNAIKKEKNYQLDLAWDNQNNKTPDQLLTLITANSCQFIKVGITQSSIRDGFNGNKFKLIVNNITLNNKPIKDADFENNQNQVLNLVMNYDYDTITMQKVALKVIVHASDQDIVTLINHLQGVKINQIKMITAANLVKKKLENEGFAAILNGMKTSDFIIHDYSFDTKKLIINHIIDNAGVQISDASFDYDAKTINAHVNYSYGIITAQTMVLTISVPESVNDDNVAMALKEAFKHADQQITVLNAATDAYAILINKLNPLWIANYLKNNPKTALAYHTFLQKMSTFHIKALRDMNGNLLPDNFLVEINSKQTFTIEYQFNTSQIQTVTMTVIISKA